MQASERVWRPAWPCPAYAILGTFRRGPGDPTYRIDGAGAHWKGIRTPVGTVTLRIRQSRDGEVLASAWGDGATWALDQVPALLGAEDDPTGFEPHHEVIREAWRRHPHWRVPRSGLVMESLVPAVIEQKVTGKQAFASFRELVHFHGERAPGPGTAVRLWVQPSPATLRAIPSWEWLKRGIEPARSRTVVAVAGRSAALERLNGLEPAEADRRLRSLPGVGVWTSAEVRARALGDADAVSFGDYHIATNVGWALTGKAVDDDGMAELLEPYRPHRHRVQRLVESSGISRPRRGPRMSLPTHLP